MDLFTLDEDAIAVIVHADHLVIDLGAVGKGYALDQCVQLLAERKISNALLNAGDSTVLGLGAPPSREGWPVTAGNRELREVVLKNNALSGSGFHVKGAHIINPRTKRPVPFRGDRVWALAPTAALSDAVSTAFMVMSREEIEAFCARNPQVTAILD
jgi:thiamine biosynthesis lipoprotein